jgi:hypothetical protein
MAVLQTGDVPQKTRGKRAFLDSGERIGEHGAEIPQDLQGIIDAWPALPGAIKAGISAMVKAAGVST